jgi:hypothetical protein
MGRIESWALTIFNCQLTGLFRRADVQFRKYKVAPRLGSCCVRRRLLRRLRQEYCLYQLTSSHYPLSNES